MRGRDYPGVCRREVVRHQESVAWRIILLWLPGDFDCPKWIRPNYKKGVPEPKGLAHYLYLELLIAEKVRKEHQPKQQLGD